MPSIQSELLPSGVRLLTFDRPGSAANTFDAATLKELNEKLDAVEECAAGVVFISAKPGIFIAGADLHALETLAGDDLRQFIELGQDVLIASPPCASPRWPPFTAHVWAAATSLCLACNWRIATADRATKIGLPETKLGILPAWGGSTRLPRLIGVARALDIILGGKTLPAKAALRRGMIDGIAPRESLLAAATKWIRDHLILPVPPILPNVPRPSETASPPPSPPLSRAAGSSKNPEAITPPFSCRPRRRHPRRIRRPSRPPSPGSAPPFSPSLPLPNAAT